MTILLAAADDNFIDFVRSAFPSQEPVVARSGLECIVAIERHVPELLILDEDLPWGGADGVLEILSDSKERWFHEMPILLHTRAFVAADYPRLRIFPFAGRRGLAWSETNEEDSEKVGSF